MRRLLGQLLALLPTLAVVAVLAGVPVAATAQDTVAVRGGAHPDKLRLVFDFAGNVDYEARVEGRRLLVTFAKPTLFDFSAARRSLEPQIGRPVLSDDARRVVIPLDKPRRLEASRLGGKLVFDLYPEVELALLASAADAPLHEVPPPAPAPQAAPAAPKAPAEAVRLRSVRQAEIERLRFVWPRAFGHSIERTEGGAVIRFDRPGRLETDGSKLEALDLVRSLEAVPGGDGLTVRLALVPGARYGALVDGTALVLDVMPPPRRQAAEAPLSLLPTAPLPAEAATPPAKQVEKEKVSPAAGQASAPAGQAAKNAPPLSLSVTHEPRAVEAVPGGSVDWPEPLILNFAWAKEVGAAALQLGDDLLLAFDAVAPAETLDTLRKLDPAFEKAAREDVPGATVLRLPLAPLVRAEVDRAGTVWSIDLRVRPAPNLDRLQSRFERDGEGERLRFDVVGGRTTVPLADPAGGAPLLLVPLTQPGQWVAEARVYPQFALLPTAQGLAVRRLGDDLEVAVGQAGVTVVAPGLMVASPGAVGRRRPGGAMGGASGEAARPLFALADWRGGPPEAYNDVRRRLQAEVVSAAPERLPIARLQLARFYFAQGLANESLGVLSLIDREHSALADDPELLLLEAASRLLAGEYDRARDLLAHPALAEEPEAELWRAALAAVAQDWPLAVAKFEPAAGLIDRYARPVRVRLRQWAVEAALGAGLLDDAEMVLEMTEADFVTSPERARHAFLQGKLAMARGKAEDAKAIWEHLVATAGGAPAAQARLELIDTALANGGMTPEAAIEQLEQLNFAWRGDAFELSLLTRLATLYDQVGKPRQALRSLRRAATYFPDSAAAGQAAARMRTLFRDLYLDPARPPLPPLEGLALYEEFRELTPAGAEGDEVIERLADQLVDIDLLDRATALLDHQVAYRLQGAEKARVGARLALVYLLDRKPGEAIAALDRSGGAELPAEVEAQRRHLRVRALADLDRPEDGLALIAEDDSQDANRLRAEILWRQRDWQGAAEALAHLLPPPPAAGKTISQADSQQIINLSVALTLAGMDKALADLRERYGAAMAAGPHKEAFALLAGDAANDRIVSVAEELAKVGRVQDFVAGYRQRMRDTQLSGLN